ncbi:PEP/pyruvate-binding domain-containing protein [Streptosporangium soli]|nr:PEP-utilizing enzyme [Streptosporangium sp. KLBMP 9127]
MTESRHTTVAQPVGALVAPLAAFGRHDLDRAGGKGANLGELIRSGFPVPGGFVVTTDAYTVLVERGGLAARIAARLAAGEDDGAGIRDDFAAVPVPAELRTAIAAAYRDLGEGPVAVRSSATAEDLPGAAFAGQQDTYLNVIGEEAVISAVHDCWASLWTERAIAYRARRGVDATDVRIAVVVQSMVDAESAGVMFTANPVTGDRDEVVIDAGSGLGEAVVSGLVTPDHYVLDRAGRIRDRRAGRREVVIRAAAGGGVTHAPGDLSAGPVVTEEALRELVSLGTAVAERFGRPQDIEWACAEGVVRLLQARPMTALPPPPLRRPLNPLQRRVVPFLVEMLQVRPYPLDLTTWMRHGPLQMVSEMTGSIGVRFPAIERLLPEEDGVVARLEPPDPRPTARTLLAPFSLLSRARRYDPARWTLDPRFAMFTRRVREEAAREPASLAWPALSRMPREILNLMPPITDLRIDYLPRSGLSLLALGLKLKLLGLGRLMPLLIVGAPTRTGAANDSLAALAAMVRADDRLRRVFAEPAPGPLAAAVRELPEFGEFRAALAEFLKEYGHRETASPLLVSAPTWGEAPDTILGLVKVLVGEPPSAVSAHRPEEALRRLLGHPVVRWTGLRSHLRRQVEAARAGVAFREDTHFYGTQALPILRRCLLEIGDRLRRAGVLAAREDVFHLRLAEIEGIADVERLGGRELAGLRSAVLARSAKRDELAGVRMIDFSAVYPPAKGGGDALVSGTPAGGGRVTGPVRVIRDSAEFGRLRSGDVLVCPYTNPAWTPLFQRAAAVVVDTGGIASHAAIVAREYGIPAIMGTGVATSELTDGRLVTVDGDLGLVTAAETAS